MRSIRYHQPGGPDRLRLDDVPTPTPKDHQSLVRVAYAGVNPVDTKIVAGDFPHAHTPCTLGIDFAGTIVSGARYAAGTRVLGSGLGFGVVRDGAYAEFVVVPDAALVPIPDDLDDATAAGLGVTFLTAWMAIVDAAQTQRGERVLVHGAGGGVGQACVQIAARVTGARVLAVVSTDASSARARALGAEATVNRKHEDIAHAVATFASARRVDVVIDVVGGAVFEASIPLLAPFGRIATIGVSAGSSTKVTIDLPAFYRSNLRIVGVGSAALGDDVRRQRLQDVVQQFQRKTLTPPEVVVLPLEHAAEAHRRMVDPEGAGNKYVLRV